MISKNVILYGAGSDIYKILDMLDANGVIPLCIGDSNSNKWGNKINGIPIVCPQNLSDFDSKTIIITASFFDSIYLDLQSVLGERLESYEFYVAPFLWFMLVNVTYNKELLDYSNMFVSKYEKQIRQMYSKQDTLTQKILEYILKVRKQNDYFFSPYSDCFGMQFVEGYFSHKELRDIEKLTFVDIGAYIGDTMEDFFEGYNEKIHRYYAYEPQSDNFKILVDNLNSKQYRNRVISVNKALGSGNKQEYFGKFKSAYGIIDDIGQTECDRVFLEPLDEQDIDIEGKLVIKMDVEGLELDVIKGAGRYIKEHKPYMAICIYHRINDIYEIPKAILDLVPCYSFVLRSGVHTHLLAIPNNLR